MQTREGSGGYAAASMMMALVVLIVAAGLSSPSHADRYRIVAPPTVYAGENFGLTIVVETESGLTKTDYSGTSMFTSTDPFAKIENVTMDAYSYTWMPPIIDRGVHMFRVKFDTLGTQIFTAMDIYYYAISGTATMYVTTNYVQVATSVTITPSPATVVKGHTLSLIGKVLDQFGRPMAENKTWSVVSGGGTVVPVGQDGAIYTVPNKTGTAIVKACSTSSPSVCNTVTITITPH